MTMEASLADQPKPQQAEQAPAPPKEKEKKYSTPDGPRFVASLQKPDDKTCYKDFFESEKLGETKLRAQQEVEKTGRPVIIFDRVEHWIIDKIEPEKSAEEKAKEAEEAAAKQPKRRGRRKKS